MKPYALEAAKEFSKQHRMLYDCVMKGTPFPSRYNTIMVQFDPKELDLPGKGLTENLLHNGILNIMLKYNEKQPISDYVIGLINKRGVGVNEFGAKYEWYSISIKNELFQGSDLLYNHIDPQPIGHKLNGAKGYRIKYFTAGNKVVVLDDHVKEYFSEVFDNWEGYEAAKAEAKANKDLYESQRNLLKLAGLKRLKKESGRDKRYFVESASTEYISSFINMQESLRLNNPYASLGEKDIENFVTMRHVLSARPDFKFLVMADILERGMFKRCAKEAGKSLSYTVMKLTYQTTRKGMDTDQDYGIFDSIAKKTLDGLIDKKLGRSEEGN